jgi:hypothetical protein
MRFCSAGQSVAAQPTTLRCATAWVNCPKAGVRLADSESYKDRKIWFSAEELDRRCGRSTESESFFTPVARSENAIRVLRAMSRFGEEYSAQIPESAMTYVERMEVNLEKMER